MYRQIDENLETLIVLFFSDISVLRNDKTYKLSVLILVNLLWEICWQFKKIREMWHQRWCNMSRSQSESVGAYLIYFYKTACIEIRLKWKGAERETGDRCVVCVYVSRCVCYMTVLVTACVSGTVCVCGCFVKQRKDCWIAAVTNKTVLSLWSESKNTD